ncbi:hypothetical protein K505DRAFT_359957 [Melanomma pulvis-pyrius CBS 109.77]|uniref:Dynamin N-terminal domain-containing protein n=1 Tax=Melanomma pulvis-pyrius CBS 109.77 TaxID=1314802 RepID=A0A6A6XGZ6_9PLEO|nr:hypothetical protein K505DRAFT_359957 [Melanomma pulvis-pyrius CBS 109.77]
MADFVPTYCRNIMVVQSKILSFEEYKNEHEREEVKVSRKAKRLPKGAKAYDPRQEKLPNHRWFKLNKPNINAQIRGIADQVIDILEFARIDDRELFSIRKAAIDVREVAALEGEEVAIVGQQGMGKSLMINALQDRRDLSKTSAKGKACTASAIKYRHKPGASDLEEIYDAAVTFMDDTCLDEIIREHIRRYGHFHFSGNVDPHYQDEEARSAATAEDFFNIVFNADNDDTAKAELESLMTASEIQSGALLSATMKMAHRRISETKAGEDRCVRFDNMEISPLLRSIENYMAQQEGFPALWAIVQEVIISLGSALSREGVCVIDLPGLGDLNQSRTAATNAIRRKAKYELHVAKSDRVATEEVVDQQLRQGIRAHTAKCVILVLTKIDEYTADLHSVETEIRENPKEPFLTIKRCMCEAENTLDALYKSAESVDDDKDDECSIRKHNAMVNLLQDYQEKYLIKAAQLAFIQQRAEEVENEMRHKFRDEDEDPIHVFSISASAYLDWLKVGQKDQSLLTPEMTPEMTGIPTLKNHLLSLTAEGNWETYRTHAFNKLPSLLNKVRRTIHSENKDNAYAVIRPTFMQLVAKMRNRHQSSFDNFLKDRIIQIWADPIQKKKRQESIIGIVKEWGNNVAWNTYNKVLRERGMVSGSKAKKYTKPDQNGVKPIWGKINWNEEISQEILHDMGAWRRKQNQEVTSFARDMDNATIDVCEEVLTSITSSSLAPLLKQVAIEEWNDHQDGILALSRRLEVILKIQVDITYRFATTETDIRCMLATVNCNVYDDIESTPRQNGRYNIQRENMVKAMNDLDSKERTLLDRIWAAVKKAAKTNFRTACTNYLNDLINEFELFDENISERLLHDYELNSSDQKIRDSLKAILPDLEKRVADLQYAFEAQEVKSEPTEYDDSESPAKRHKLEEIPPATLAITTTA